MRYVECFNCGCKIPEGSRAIRDSMYIGFYCSTECYLKGRTSAKYVDVTDELVKEDNEVGEYYNWIEEEENR